MSSRKTKVFTGIVVAVGLVAAIASGVVHAQMDRGPGPGPGMAPPLPPAPRANMKAGTDGVYVLCGPALLKYTSGLKEPSTLVLFEPGKPEVGADTDTPRPPMGAIDMLVTPAGSGPEKVLVLAGNQLFCIDGASFKVLAKATLPEIEAPTPGPEGPEPGIADSAPGMGGPGPGGPGPAFGPRPVGPPPSPMELQGNTLYVMRANQIVAISVSDGKVTAQATLPQPAKHDPGDK